MFYNSEYMYQCKCLHRVNIMWRMWMFSLYFDVCLMRLCVGDIIQSICINVNIHILLMWIMDVTLELYTYSSNFCTMWIFISVWIIVDCCIVVFLQEMDTFMMLVCTYGCSTTVINAARALCYSRLVDCLCEK